VRARRELGVPPTFAGGPMRVFDVLVGDGLRDVGVHSGFLSLESCFSTWIRMN
jgi:hypothetical protein